MVARNTVKKPPVKTSKPVTAVKVGNVKKIENIAIVAYRDQAKFITVLKQEIDRGQNLGYETEVQYSCSVDTYTAIILYRAV